MKNNVVIYSLVLLFAGCGATNAPMTSAEPVKPYTRAAGKAAMAKIERCIGVFAGSRYAYVDGYRVRLDNQDKVHGAEAIMHDGRIFVPADFAGVLKLKKVVADKAPDYLKDRWVYTIQIPKAGTGSARTIEINGKKYVDLAQMAGPSRKIYRNDRGLLLISDEKISFGPGEEALLECVITLFDTPDKFADPDIATKYIPRLKEQGKWTDHAKVTAEQLKLLAAPEAQWPETPRSQYDLNGFNALLLGSKVPAPGVYPRLLFSEEDIPMFRQRARQSKVMQKSLMEMEILFNKTWWDPTTMDGKLLDRLSRGETVDPCDMKNGGIHSSHVNYVTNCLTSMAFYCLMTGDDKHGKQAAYALYNYYKQLEPRIDEHLATSDSEFGVNADLANNSSTQFRGMHGLIAHMDLPFALDFGGKWMMAEQKDLMRRVIAKATYGRRTNGGDGPRRAWRDINHMTWHLTHLLALASIEGLEGFDEEAYKSGAELTRDFLEWGIDESGQIFESNGKSGGGLQFQVLSMVTLARRGDNIWGHPHWRKLLTAQVYTTSPNGKDTVSSGTWGGGPLSLQSVLEIKAFYPEDKSADYLLSLGYPDLDPAKLDLDAYRAKLTKSISGLRLPGPTYCGFTNSVLYDTDWQRIDSRQPLGQPLDWNDPVHGVLSSVSDNTVDATWLCLHVRANHYIGSGHHHADVGMFYMSGQGVNWITESPIRTNYSGKLHNLVLIDGVAENDGPPAKGKYLGASMGPDAAFGTADLSYAYSWKWCTQVEKWGEGFSSPQVYFSLKGSEWELEPDPDIIKYYQGTERYKFRTWWPTSNFSNWIPTLRASWNPVKYVYRSAGLVRGKHPYVMIVDDAKKDDRVRLYQWAGMLSQSVRKADYPGLAANQIVLGTLAYGVKGGLLQVVSPQNGDALLLVCAIDMTESSDEKLPLVQVDVDKVADKEYARLLVNRRAADVGYKMLMVPFRHGQEMPRVTYDKASSTAKVEWTDQVDEISFAAGDDNRTKFAIKRDGLEIVSSK
jgi:hypothetical protein